MGSVTLRRGSSVSAMCLLSKCVWISLPVFKLDESFRETSFCSLALSSPFCGRFIHFFLSLNHTVTSGECDLSRHLPGGVESTQLLSLHLCDSGKHIQTVCSAFLANSGVVKCGTSPEVSAIRFEQSSLSEL